MNDFYTFIVISTINTPHSVFSNTERYEQTLKTFDSIRIVAPNSKIVFVDNSVTQLNDEWREKISEKVDLWVNFENNLFTKLVNRTGNNKGLNELFQMETALNEIKRHNLVGRRIFKISGRYTLNPGFVVDEYLDQQYDGKYVFKIVPWLYDEGKGPEVRNFFCTVLWSMCSDLIDEYLELLNSIFTNMLYTNENIEMSHNRLIPRDKLVLKDHIGAEGPITGGEYTHI
jgi:hypothetical protein